MTPSLVRSGHPLRLFTSALLCRIIVVLSQIWSSYSSLVTLPYAVYMYVCMFVCMYVCIFYMRLYVCICITMYVCTCMYVCVCMFCIYVCMCV